MKLREAFPFRMRPDAVQSQALARMAGASLRVCWALAQRQEHYQKAGKFLPPAELSRRLTAPKQPPETAWLRDFDSQALSDFERAYQNFFQRRARFPRFMSRKGDRAKFRIPQRVMVSEGRIHVPKVGSVRIRQSRPVEGESKKRDLPTGRLWKVKCIRGQRIQDSCSPPGQPILPRWWRWISG